MEDHETLETLPNRHMEIAERLMNGQMSADEAGKARGALDQKLDRISKALAEAHRSLVGQIEEPSLADWEAANDACGVWAEVEYEAMRAEWEREQKANNPWSH